MKQSLKIFIAIEAILALTGLYSVLHSGILRFLLFAVILLFIFHFIFSKGNKKPISIAMIILLSFIVLSNFFVWLMLIVAVIFFLFFFQDGNKGKIKFGNGTPDLEIIETEPPKEKGGTKSKSQLFGSMKIGKEAYEWDDINLFILAGDTIIDIGNTILPNEENIILIRKGMGRTRILVPTGVGVSLSHHSLLGEVDFLGIKEEMVNQNLTIYSEDYEQSTKKIRIASDLLIGEFEVIRT